MKEIKAYIQPFMLQKVTDALHEIHSHGMGVSELKGFGREKDERYPHHVGEAVVDFTPKVKIEIVCPDEECDRIVNAIQHAAHTGRRGDGKIFVSTCRRPSVSGPVTAGIAPSNGHVAASRSQTRKNGDNGPVGVLSL